MTHGIQEARLADHITQFWPQLPTVRNSTKVWELSNTTWRSTPQGK